MAIVRALSNGMKVTDWTQEVLEIGNMYGVINQSGVFGAGIGCATESVVFEKSFQNAQLIQQSSRRGSQAVKNKDRQSAIFSLALPYFHHIDLLTPQDIQGYRMVGTADQAETLSNAISIKLEDMKANIDQTKEYMKLCAIQGVTTDPDGTVIADMFDEFGLNANDFDVAWDLGNNGFDLSGAIRDLRRKVTKNVRTGMAASNVHMLVTPEFFDALVKHPDVIDAYMFANASRGTDPMRDALASYHNFGVTESFTFQGFNFMSYEPEFTGVNGDVVRGIGHDGRRLGTRRAEKESMGIVLVDGVRDLYRAYYGASNTLSGANQIGQPVFTYQWNDPKDKYIELEMETSPLYVCMRPQVAMRVFNAASLHA